MFLPLCMVSGCNSKQPWYPYGMYTQWPSISDFFQGLLFNWPYLFGVVAGLGAFIVAWTGQARHFRLLWAGYTGAIVLSVLGMWSVMGRQWRERGVPASFAELAEEGWLLVPTIVLLSVLLITYFNCRTWFSAALWVQLLLAALSCAWFGWVAFEFGADLLIGGKIAIASSAGLFLGTVVERLVGLEELGISFRARPCHQFRIVPAPASSEILSNHPV
jgi:hypothetical protein